MEQGKVCKECGEFKSFDEFYKYPTGKYGYTSKCKKCENKRKTPREEKECIFCKKKFIGTPKKKCCSDVCKIEYRKEKSRKTKKLIINENGRQCSKCETYKTWDNYDKHSGKKYGHTHICKQCRKDNYNPEINKVRRKIYRENNLEKISERDRKYRESTQGKNTAHKKRLKRRSCKYKVIFTPFERIDILERDKWTCQSCGCKVHDRSTGNWNTPDKAHIDHIIPISKGGNSEPDNLQELCRTCNLTKSDKIDEELIHKAN